MLEQQKKVQSKRCKQKWALRIRIRNRSTVPDSDGRRRQTASFSTCRTRRLGAQRCESVTPRVYACGRDPQEMATAGTTLTSVGVRPAVRAHQLDPFLSRLVSRERTLVEPSPAFELVALDGGVAYAGVRLWMGRRPLRLQTRPDQVSARSSGQLRDQGSLQRGVQPTMDRHLFASPRESALDLCMCEHGTHSKRRRRR